MEAPESPILIQKSRAVLRTAGLSGPAAQFKKDDRKDTHLQVKAFSKKIKKASKMDTQKAEHGDLPHSSSLHGSHI